MSSSAFLMRTLPLPSVAERSTSVPNTHSLALSMCLTVPSESRVRTKPFIRNDSVTVMPGILATRTLSTLKFCTSLGRIWMQALATSGARKSSRPYCLAAMGERSARVTCASLRRSSIFQAQRLSMCLSTALVAVMYPEMMSAWCSPCRSSPSALSSSTPAITTTRLVASPISSSCVLAASATSLAAGCTTSISRTMVAASLVTNCLPMWLTTILFIPLGPIDVRVISESFLHASMFFSTASSTPEKCLAPSLRRSVSPTPPDDLRN
mmetsp:Transcript_18910/g.46418  ORF Transcript_18910/g.46418 Transcript_18910/m.46418 type:complete len:267 (+) Transcript_18910:474-1274(+)